MSASGFNQMLIRSALFGLACVSILSINSHALPLDVSGYVGAEWREHLQDGQFNNQAQRQLSLVAEPELVTSFDDDLHTLTFKPYVRLDSEDDERTHFDVRELSWLTYGDDWELQAGISKVYWGVTESQHLVDVINQTDFVEAPDGEDKLGQPMIRFALIRDWGTLNGFVLPGFRERTFPGEEGRFRTPLVVDTDNARYQASEKASHIDLALRWAHTLDVYDVGVSWFQGTSRDPLFVPRLNSNLIPVALTPYYPLIQQTGLDVQATFETWLFKLESIYRRYDSHIKQQFSVQNLEDFVALTTGGEYTLYELFDNAWEVGVIAEYQWDSRNDASQALGQNDLFGGARLAFNDAASSELLIGIGQDLDHTSSRSLIAEGSTRWGDSLKLNIDVGLFFSDAPRNISYSFRQDDYVQLGANYYF